MSEPSIIVCIKQVPDTQAIKIDPVTNTLIRQGVPAVINPFDENAIEEALRLKESFGGSITALCMGPAQAERTLRDALAMGVDKAILLSDSAFAGADTWATSLVLSTAIKKIGIPDLVLCGKQAIDGDTGQVGPGVAEFLGMPVVTNIRKLVFLSGKVQVERMMEEGYEAIDLELPALLTLGKEINTPRLPGIAGKLSSKKAVIQVWTAESLGMDKSLCGLKGSPTFVKRVFYPELRRTGEILDGDVSRLTATAVERLKAWNLLPGVDGTNKGNGVS